MDYTLSSLLERLSWGPCVLILAVLALILFGRTPPVRASDLYVNTLPALREVSRTVDGLNTTRQADFLVVYTASHPGTTTGTNQWGNEVVVQNGRVVSVGGNNQTIPVDGLVVSAHGNAIPWLQDNLPYGARVELNGTQLRAIVDEEAHRLTAERAFADANDLLTQSLNVLTGTAIEQAVTFMDEAEAALAAGDYGVVIQYTAEARYAATPSFPIEVRGVWHRPTEVTPQLIGATLDRLQAAGINAIFLETFYTGYTIYPSKIAPQRPHFLGWDPLAVWAEEASRRDIELHLWVHLFHLGQVTINRHPQWTNLERGGSIGATLEPGLYYGDPGHPEVQQYVFDVLNEMVERYRVAGLHLDYVRYPNTTDLSNTSGYSPTSRRLFEEAHGYDPMDIAPNTHAEVWADWLRWQEQNITQFVERIHHWVSKDWPELIISAAVVPDINEAIRTKRQNWLAWTESGWIDLLTPMIYSLDNGHVARQIRDLAGKTGSAWFVPGLAPYMGMSPHQVIEQVNASRKEGRPGAVLFALHSIHAEHRDAFAKGLFSVPATLPWNRDEAIGTFGTWLIEGMNRWVAEDLLPSDTALALDELAHEMVSWHNDGSADEPNIERWINTLSKAETNLQGPFYGEQSLWLQQQINLMINVLTRGA